MASKEEEVDYFAVMGLKPSATEAEIRRAHKKLSLALHPDKNRHMDAAVAAARFSEMQLAYEVLMDPSARLAASERYKAEQSRKERQAGFEGKRKAMADELERREEEEREKKSKTMHDERSRKETLAKLREEGKKLREERERKSQVEKDGISDESSQQAQDIPQKATEERPSSPEPELGPLDLTVRLRFPSDLQSALRGDDQSEDPSVGLSSPLAKALTFRFGSLDALLFRPFKQGKREASALATFKSLSSAFAAVTAGSQLKAGGSGIAHILDDVWIGWASNKKGGSILDNGNTASSTALPGEPERIAWRRRHGKLSSKEDNAFGANSEQDQNIQQPYSRIIGDNIASESSILERMRGNATN